MLSFPIERHDFACIELIHLFIMKQILLFKKKKSHSQMYSVIQNRHLGLGYFLVCYPHNLNINTIDEETVIIHGVWSTKLLLQDEESLKQSSSVYRV